MFDFAEWVVLRTTEQQGADKQVLFYSYIYSHCSRESSASFIIDSQLDYELARINYQISESDIKQKLFKKKNRFLQGLC